MITAEFDIDGKKRCSFNIEATRIDYATIDTLFVEGNLGLIYDGYENILMTGDSFGRALFSTLNTGSYNTSCIFSTEEDSVAAILPLDSSTGLTVLGSYNFASEGLTLTQPYSGLSNYFDGLLSSGIYDGGDFDD